MRARLGSRLRWTLAGTALLLLALEGSFRLAGLALHWAVRPGRSGAVRTILCEGDSFTFGIGGRGFPSQLEEILNERAGRRLYRTVNLGMPGLNTALLADVFESHLLYYRPDVILVVVGEDNFWNRIRLQTTGRRLPWAAALDGALMRSRVYKFFKIAWIGLSRSGLHREDPRAGGAPARRRATIPEADALIKASAFAARRDCGKALPLYRRFAAANPDDPAGHAGAGLCLMSENRYAEAVAELRQALRGPATPELETAYFELGWALFRSGSREEALACWTRGQALFPASRRLAEAPGLAEGRTPAAPALAPADETTGAVSQGFRADIRRICALAKAHGIPLVFGSYPDVAHPEVYETAAEEGAGFVDFHSLFQKRFHSRAEYLSSDNCHCNTQGYRAMAEAFADEVERSLEGSGARHMLLQ